MMVTNMLVANIAIYFMIFVAFALYLRWIKHFLRSWIFPFNSPFETPSTLTWCKAIAKYSLLMPFKILGLVCFILHDHDEKGDDE